jgi:hypothetical protein
MGNYADFLREFRVANFGIGTGSSRLEEIPEVEDAEEEGAIHFFFVFLFHYSSVLLEICALIFINYNIKKSRLLYVQETGREVQQQARPQLNRVRSIAIVIDASSILLLLMLVILLLLVVLAHAAVANM